MNSFYVFLVFALTAMVAAEAPTGYSYPRGGGGGGFVGGGGGGFSGGGGGGGGLFGGTYRAVSGGYQTNEGIQVEPQLLEQIRRILLTEESKSGGGGGGFPSGGYRAPSPQYGVPAYDGGRVVGIDLEGVRQAIQVAQFEAQTTIAGGGGGYPAARPASSYGTPF